MIVKIFKILYFIYIIWTILEIINIQSLFYNNIKIKIYNLRIAKYKLLIFYSEYVIQVVK